MENFQDLSNMAVEVHRMLEIQDLPILTLDIKQDFPESTLVSQVKLEDQNSAKTSSEDVVIFKQFSLFPVEIRNKIWSFTVEPRLVKDKFCRMPLKLEPLAPLNIVPYDTMPGSFRACFESKEEVTKSYEQIGITGEECATRGIVLERTPQHLSPFAPLVPFNKNLDVLSFDSLYTISAASSPRLSAERWLLQFNTPIPPWWQPWRTSTTQPWLINPWDIKRVQITPLSLLSPDDRENDMNYRNNCFDFWDRIFFNFVFQDLEEFIIQDLDCNLPHRHMFYSIKNKFLWRDIISRMFRVESSHNEFANMRAGSQFKLPKIVFRQGSKISTPCQYCRAASKRNKEERKNKKRQ
ncbi:hypothetical protein BELL_0406g00060 [Botrytis elliptica]|uniref:2EXR domain-containing protein n=1 Tax=Botrytis elliptica TaxID=278938 RepID=A0A4Z1JUL8_9HELO|nr:hypothetical protein EAE99_009565 [Botrytis elliptica]TGO72923.1 hypothetical protein BELL_0406g00060 [Botrytis elliptica]